MARVVLLLAVGWAVAGASGCGDARPTVATDPAAERATEEQVRKEAEAEGKARRGKKVED